MVLQVGNVRRVGEKKKKILKTANLIEITRRANSSFNFNIAIQIMLDRVRTALTSQSPPALLNDESAELHLFNCKDSNDKCIVKTLIKTE